MTWAVVPLKSPERAKTRLAGVLSPMQRQQLLFALAERVIRALLTARGIDNVAVITASPQVAAFARSLGALAILQSDETGTASAFMAAVRHLEPLRLRSMLMIAGDLPLVSPAAVERLLSLAGSGPGALVVPDRHRTGTNALLCTPPRMLAPCFGHDSFRRHLAAAESAGVQARVMEIEELALDLDVAGDIEELRTRNRALAAALFGMPHGIGDEAPRPRMQAGTSSVGASG